MQQLKYDSKWNIQLKTITQ